VSRLPIRTRLTLAFTSAVAVVFLLAGTFLYLRLERSLDAGINSSLQTQAGQVAALVRQADSGLRQSAARGDGFAQILTARGLVLDASPQLGAGSVLRPAQVRDGLRQPLGVDRVIAVRGVREHVRLLATPVAAQDQRLLVVVGASLVDRDQALSTLRTELLLGGPAALLAVAIAGYLLARAALRPVEAMRLAAERLSGTDLDERMPLTHPNDEIRRLGSTLNGLLARLEQSMVRERRFVSDASHELRTPLALLRTELELALRRPRSDGELRAALTSAVAEAERLAELADGLLVLARRGEGELPVASSITPVEAILESVARRFRPRAEELGRAIRVDDRFAGEASIDAAQVEQALANLVGNALRHGRGTTTIGASLVAGGLELSVEDEGDGFDAEFLPRAFERFSQADESRSGSGSGLGLAIVDAIVSAHGGTATASNHEPRGGRVEIRFPDAAIAVRYIST
jgi:heavy metal sensor kinase